MINPDQNIYWRKSMRSSGQGGNCVEVVSTLTAVRDSKNPNGPVLRAEVGAFINEIKSGKFDG